jgi:arylsulfatase
LQIARTAAFAVAFSVTAAAAQESSDPPRPNILIIWGDDVGMWNISAYHRGMMGGETPNIDRIAEEGMLFMDHHAKASCTAGRAAFLTGQYPLRVGPAGPEGEAARGGRYRWDHLQGAS